MSNDVEEIKTKYVTIPLQLLRDGKFPEDINEYTRGWNDALDAAYLIAQNWKEKEHKTQQSFRTNQKSSN